MTSEHRGPVGTLAPAQPRDAAAAPLPAAPRDLRPGRGRVLGIGVTQLVVCELAIVAGALAAARSLWLLTAAVPVALVAVLLAVGRWHGRWLYEELQVRRDFRRRAGRARLPQTDDARLTLLRELLPALEVVDVADRSGVRVGMLTDGRCWSVLLAVEAAPDAGDAADGSPLPLGIVADALRTRDVRLAGVQVLVHTVPAPTAALPPDAPCVRSYRGLSTEAVPARRSTWIALNLDPEQCAAAVAARGGGALGAQRALLGTRSRLATSLQMAGVDARVVPAEEMLAVLALAAGAAARGNAEGAPRTAEWWDAWAVDDTVQACFWVRKWPRLSRAGDKALLARLGEVRGAFNAVSLTMTNEDARGLHVRALVRVAGASRGDLQAIEAELRHIADEARLVRLDGEQLPAVLETLPLGGVSR